MKVKAESVGASKSLIQFWFSQIQSQNMPSFNNENNLNNFIKASEAIEPTADAEALTRVALVHLTNCIYGDVAIECLRGTSLSAKAAAMNPYSTTALHSLAVSLELLGAPNQARSTWRHLYSTETDASWQNETSQQLLRLSELNEVEEWEEFEGAGRVPSTFNLQLLREKLLKTVLSTIAEKSSTIKDLELQTLEEISTLEDLSGDLFLSELVEANNRLPERLRNRVAFATSELIHAKHLLDHFQASEALPILYTAKPAFGKTIAPLAALTDYYISLALYYTGSKDRAFNRAAANFDHFLTRKYYSLAGHTGRLLGPLQREFGYPEEALKVLSTTQECFRKTGENGHLASALSTLASAYKDLGEYDQEWKYRLPSLRLAGSYGDISKLPVVFGVAALSASERGEYETALALLSETFYLELSSGISLNIAEAYW